jgi:hypothetical protein
LLIITPQQFKDAFLDVLREKEPQVVSMWEAAYTDYTSTIRECLQAVAERLQLHIYNRDYYTLDAIYYEEMDLEHFGEDSTYVKYISIALEHENRLIGTEAEINKLQLLNTPLKVLITYADGDAKYHYLSKYAKIIENADVFDDVSTTKKQLVIFGSCDGKITEWSFHLYQQGGFVLI